LDGCPIKDDPTKAICVNCKGSHSAAFRGCSKYQEVSKALKVSVVDKVSYRDPLVKVMSQTGVLHRTLGGATGVQPPVTSTPVVVPPPAPRMPAPDAPPARFDLFQPTDVRSKLRHAR